MPQTSWFRLAISFTLHYGVHKLITLLFFCLFSVAARAQSGTSDSFDFVNVPATSRLVGLGGVNVSLADRDVGLLVGNPSLAGDTLSGIASASYQFYVADIGQAFFAYAHPFRKIGTLLFAVQHIGYGNIRGYDASGTETGEFRSGETALMVGKNHCIADFRMGVTLKGVFSNIAGYRASAVMLDLGGVFIHPNKSLTVGLAIKNLGVTVDEYSRDSNSRLPFDVQFGATLKPEQMPLRFSFTGYNLTRYDNIPYDNAGDDEEKPGMVKKVLSHVNMGAEVLLHKNVTILVGYNYRIHQELRLPDGGGGAGISFGFAAQIKSFEFVFSRGALVAGNAGYSFTLSTNTNKFLKTRQRV